MAVQIDEKWGEGLQQWTWEMVEKERLRGLEVARAWLATDRLLAEESARVVS